MFIKRNSPTSSATPSKQATGQGQGAAGAGIVEDPTKEKTLEEKREELIEKKAAEYKKDEERAKLEQLEYYKFPNIMGWYFDGTFTKDFTLHEEYAEYFNEIEDEMDAQKDLIIAETFTEKAYRNFWPPTYIGGKYLRTRGVYLDFPEVKADPPKTPPNINYEKQRGIIGVDMGDDAVIDADDTGKGIRFYSDTYGLPGTGSNRDNWYWNETKRDFKPKELDGDYWWQDDERIFREADPTYRTPYDWYFDDRQGRYFIRNRSTPDAYEFDQEKNIYRKKDAKGPSTNGYRHNDYFYDEKQRKWILVNNPTGNITACVTGNREVVEGDRGKSGKIPDDFYYDGVTGKMEVKDVNNTYEYYYDTFDKMFKKKGQPYGPGKANHYPTDYEFDYRLGNFFPKPAKECRHIEPYDWYFDMSQGKFFRIDGLQREKYAFDSESNLFKLKDAMGPSANGLTPEDYFWSEEERQWKLVITLKDPDVLEVHEPGKRRILKGERGKTGKVPDDWYYDAYDGSFFLKNSRKLEHFWYDPVDLVWKKRGQPYGPGFYQLFPEHYYFDYDEGLWLPTTSAKMILAKRKRGEVKGLSDLTPYDYAFYDNDGTFHIRDKDSPRFYKYNPKTGVFHKEGQKGPASNGKSPKDYFFDERTCAWLPLEHPKGHEARDYRNGRRNNREGPRGKTNKIPDDYYFSFEKGEFRLKEREESNAQYEYLPDLGVWRNVADPPPPGPSNVPQTKDFYFDKEEGQFRLKKELEYGEIYLNPNTNLWMQRWRRPVDYYWEPKQNKYLRKPAAIVKQERAREAGGAGGVGFEGFGEGPGEPADDRQRDKEWRRDYEKPWLHNYLHLAADEIRFEQELVKQTKAKEGKKKRSELNNEEEEIVKVPEVKETGPEAVKITPDAKASETALAGQGGKMKKSLKKSQK